jgi:hypothetical protein
LAGNPSLNGGVIAPAASPEEAAAIAGAIERFLRDTARAPAGGDTATVDPWQRVALLEGVRRQPAAVLREPWING